jgi:glucokinase
LADTSAPGFSRETTLPCADYASADAAIARYLEDVGSLVPRVICLAAAGPVIDQAIKFTNNPWCIAVQELEKKYPDAAIRLLNDFEAIAYSVPHLSMQPDLNDRDQFTVAIIGPGTGLGTAGLKKSGDALVPIVSEASHSGFAPETGFQREVLDVLRGRFERVSVERLVSGKGIENLYWALGRLRGSESSSLSAEQIFAAEDDHATETVQLFFEILGQYAGDIALAFGAADGVFIAGGIVRRYPEKFAASRFRSGFESKGRYRSHMESIPTQLIMHPQPGLLGASYVALELLRGTEVMPTS